MSTETIVVETRGRVGIIRLNRPQALNALNIALKSELLAAAEAFDADAGIGCIVITGSDKAFAAGADIKEMADGSYIDVFGADYAADYERLARAQADHRRGRRFRARRRLRARDDVRSSSPPTTPGSASPKIKLRVIPGIGGTQRLTRAVGKAKAMDLILTGRMMDAGEAERSGLVARVIAGSKPDGRDDEGRRDHRRDVAAVGAGGEEASRSFETSLAEGVRFERRVFHALFATKDQKEGMAAFVAKRPPSSGTNDAARIAAHFRTQITRTSDALAASTPPRPAATGASFCAWRKARMIGAGTSAACGGPPIAHRPSPPSAARPCRLRAHKDRARRRRKAWLRRGLERIALSFADLVEAVAAAALGLRIGDADEREVGPLRSVGDEARGHEIEARRTRSARSAFVSSAWRSASPYPPRSLQPSVTWRSVRTWPAALTTMPVPYSTLRLGAAPICAMPATPRTA